jgi:hypothetical protein
LNYFSLKSVEKENFEENGVHNKVVEGNKTSQNSSYGNLNHAILVFVFF